MADTDDQTRKPKWLKDAEKNQEEARLKESLNPLVLDIFTASSEAPSSSDVVESAFDQVFDALHSNDVESVSIRPGNEFPLLFTRLPIFIPTRRIRQKNDLMDINTAVHFECPFGSGARKGPPLTVFDEDVFFALLKLRQNRVTGEGSKMPIECSGFDLTVNVDHLICNVLDVLEILGIKRNGKAYERVVTSIKNMAATTIELEKRIVDRYFGPYHKGASFRLYQVKWVSGPSETVFEIQFEPVITRWLQSEFSYVDWNIRKQIKSPLAKAVHRFLSSQGRLYEISLKKLSATVGSNTDPSKFSNRLRSALDELVAIGFLDGYEIRGSGRRAPQMLVTWRKGVIGMEGSENWQKTVNK